jgi:hypothetical protein
MGQKLDGNPFTGYVSLTNAAPGPVNIPIFTVMGVAAYTIQPSDKLYILFISVSSNDTAQALVTVDTAGTTPTKLLSQYLSSTQPPGIMQAPWGSIQGIAGTLLRATASAVTSGKTVEVLVYGTVGKT